MKNNYIAKHMNTYNKSSVHIDRKKESISSEEEIKDGVQEFLTSFEKYQEETLDDVWKEAKELSKKYSIKPPPELSEQICDLRTIEHPTLEQRLIIESIDFQKGIKFLDE